MKKLTFLMALMLMMVFGAKSAFAAQVYTSYNSSTKTLTYYYDDKYGDSDRPNSEKYDPLGGLVIRWAGYYEDVTKVVIDASMMNVKLTSMSSMFEGTGNRLKNVTTISGISNLNTSDVENMQFMFQGMRSLQSLDLKDFNTAKVTSMYHMFEDCAALTSLDLTSFNTAKVTNMQSMFAYCESLQSLNLSSFNTTKVTKMGYMFSGCKALTTLDISKFYAPDLTDAEYMFADCPKLTTIYCNADMSNNDKLTSSDKMFYLSDKIKGGKGTTYDSSKLNKSYARPDKSGSKGYFTEKDVLFAEMSGDGTIMYIYYDTNIRYANFDWNADGLGTNNMTTEAKEKITEVSISPSVANALPTTCRQWFHGMKNLTKITGINYLNTSECTNMRAMFSECNNLASLDVSGFNTAKVTNMSAMFYGCEKLTTIDVKNFNTANVTTMAYMFQYCNAVKKLDVSGFNTEKVTNMCSMFNNCKALTSLYLRYFNTAKVKDMSYMFGGASALTMLDLTKFNTANVTTMKSMFNSCSAMEDVWLAFDMSKVENTDYMFRNCTKLKTIHCDGDWNASSKLTSSTEMFIGCTALKGEYGTAYNSSFIDKSYARPDHGTNLPGYFSSINQVYTYKNGNTLYYKYDAHYSASDPNYVLYDPIALPNVERWSGYADQITKVVIEASMKEAPLTSTRKMFYGGSTDTYLSNVTAIEGLGNLNTSKVDNMSLMFMGCSKLETMDVNVLDVSNVETMVQMFSHCSSLKTIYCSKDWSASVTSSTNMFYNCTSLRGGNGTAYNSSIKDATYARPDEDGQPGYFTSSSATGLENVQSDKVQGTKILRDGQLYILRDGRTYNMQGMQVK